LVFAAIPSFCDFNAVAIGQQKLISSKPNNIFPQDSILFEL